MRAPPDVIANKRLTEPRRFLNPLDGCWHVQITQGETHVTDSPHEVLTTVLGSCISACMRDPALGIGGMNHFLLPNGDGRDANAMRYGVNAMELLINGLLKRGGSRSRLEAKLFGGASVVSGLSDVGARNIAFAQTFLQTEGIAVVGGDLGGDHSRRIQYWPSTGRARQFAMLTDDRNTVIARELASSRIPSALEGGAATDVELF